MAEKRKGEGGGGRGEEEEEEGEINKDSLVTLLMIFQIGKVLHSDKTVPTLRHSVQKF